MGSFVTHPRSGTSDTSDTIGVGVGSMVTIDGRNGMMNSPKGFHTAVKSRHPRSSLRLLVDRTTPSSPSSRTTPCSHSGSKRGSSYLCGGNVAGERGSQPMTFQMNRVSLSLSELRAGVLARNHFGVFLKSCSSWVGHSQIPEWAAVRSLQAERVLTMFASKLSEGQVLF